MKKHLLVLAFGLFAHSAMADQLYIQVSSQITPDPARSTVAGVLNYVAPNVYGQPASSNVIYDYGVSDNSAATPYPVFTGDVSARAYFDPIWAANLISAANTALAGATTYTTYNVQDVEAPVYADFNALATVARTGSYTDLSNTPAIPAAQVNTDWNSGSGLSQLLNKPILASVATSGAYADLTGRPTIPTVPTNISAFTNDSAFITTSGAPVQSISGRTGAVVLTSSDVGLGNVNNTSDANKPVSTAAQTALNAKFNSPSGTTGQYVRGDGILATLPAATVVQAYEGTAQRLNAFPIFVHATVASGVAVFNLTSDGTSSGSALFPNGVIQDSVNPFVSDSTASYQMATAWSNSNKTVTITIFKLGTANILTGLLGQATANGAVVKMTVWGY